MDAGESQSRTPHRHRPHRGAPMTIRGIVFGGTLFEALKCDLGFHEWEEDHSMTVRGVGGELGGYYFLPSTLTFYHCKHCFETMQEKRNFRGDLIEVIAP